MKGPSYLVQAKPSLPNVITPASAREAHHPLSDRYAGDAHDSPSKSGNDEREHAIIQLEASASNPARSRILDDRLE